MMDIQGDKPTNNQALSIPDLIPATVVSQYVYCPRSFYLQWVNGEFEHNADTMEGLYKHKRIDEGRVYSQDEIIHETSVMLSSYKHRLIAKMDLIKLANNIAIPVEYKKRKMQDGIIKESEKAQLCVQAIILRENKYTCNGGFIYYMGSKSKLELVITDELINWTLQKVNELINTALAEKIPEVLINDERCIRCSLVNICMPDELSKLSHRNSSEIRRLHPARPDTHPLIIQKNGVYLSKSGEEIIIKENGQKIDSARFIDISDISVFGNVQVTTQLIHELLNREIPLCYFSSGGWFQGLLFPSWHKNIELRIAQYAKERDLGFTLNLSKQIIIGKVKNCRTILRRNINPISKELLNGLSNIIGSISKAHSKQQLLGFEGNAAAIYFTNFSNMIKVTTQKQFFTLKNRNKRPPKDPINALLSYSYTLLVKELFVTIMKVGLDPYLGFMHSPKYGRPALALDLIEEFRPIICDSTVISVINNKEIQEKHFDIQSGNITLNEKGRKIFLEAFYRRLDTLITHPIFKYKVSYKRIFEIQTRLLSRYIVGETKEYIPFMTR